GAGAPVTYPSLVNERLVRVQAALDRATVEADQHQPDVAAATLMSARTNLRKAWTSAQYIITNAPPPVVATDAAFHPQSFTHSGRLKIRKVQASAHLKAHKSGGAVAGGVASIYDTAFAVLSLQHRMATLSTGLIDTAHSTLLASLSTSLFAALNGRDQAIAYIHSIDVAPPPATDARVKARAAGTPVATSGWATVMPNLVPLLDDEIQQVNGTIAAGALRAGTRHVLLDALAQDTASEASVNQFWPPLPPGDG
ncbi:MAG: hypothetical protein JWR63_3720, partial [Conexibacter sp.]|nr:hypothetical protein [Conexibacter sp.]